MNNPEVPDIYAWAPIQPCIYEAVIHMYDRYIEVFLTAPIKKGTPEIMCMSEFVNHILVRGLIEYSAFLIPLEKELGII